MREHHPMRYNRMTEILKTVASIKLSSTFLLKSYFMKKPLTMLTGLYFFNIMAIGYIVFALERSNGTCMAWVKYIHFTDNENDGLASPLSEFTSVQTFLL